MLRITTVELPAKVAPPQEGQCPRGTVCWGGPELPSLGDDLRALAGSDEAYPKEVPGIGLESLQDDLACEVVARVDERPALPQRRLAHRGQGRILHDHLGGAIRPGPDHRRGR